MVLAEENVFEIGKGCFGVKTQENLDWGGISLFNSYQFVRSRDYPGEIFTYYLKDGESISAKINIHLLEGSAESFFRSTYGSVELSGSSKVSDTHLGSFVSYVLDNLKANGAKTIHISHYPDFFSNSNRISEILLKMGFNQSYRDINHFIKMTEKSFYERLKKHGKHKKLNKSRTKGIEVIESSSENLPSAYQIIRESRESRNIRITMSMSELKEMFTRFPDRYRLFLAIHEQTIIGTLIAILVNDEVIYTFYYGHRSVYNAISPSVALLEYTYDFARRNNFSIIDLGRSSDRETQIEGVKKFKESLDAVIGFKSYFEMTL